MRALSIVLAALAVSTTPAAAQFRQQTPEQSGFGLTIDLAFAEMGGSIGDSLGAGFGASAAGFYQLGELPARIGAGGSYTRFSTEGPGDALNKLSLFAMGSWHIADPGTAVVPYLLGQIGYVRLDDDEFCEASLCGQTLRGRTWSGLELGAAVGVDIPMTETLNIDVAGTFSWVTLGDMTAGGLSIDETSTQVSTFGLRAGVTIFPR